MHLGYHGGMCCGIKVIRNFGIDPSQTTGALMRIVEEGSEEFEEEMDNAPDCCGRDVDSNDRFFFPGAPVETPVERLDRYLEYLRKYRPRGIVEVCLADDEDDDIAYRQTPLWRPVLEERGFREVNNCMNSNSGNRVFVFHKNME